MLPRPRRSPSGRSPWRDGPHAARRSPRPARRPTVEVGFATAPRRPSTTSAARSRSRRRTARNAGNGRRPARGGRHRQAGHARRCVYAGCLFAESVWPRSAPVCARRSAARWRQSRHPGGDCCWPRTRSGCDSPIGSSGGLERISPTPSCSSGRHGAAGGRGAHRSTRPRRRAAGARATGTRHPGAWTRRDRG